MVDQSHLSARRAACMTSSCVRPVARPDESSLSRRIASARPADSSVSARPASMLSPQSAWASETRSGSGRAIASARSLSALIAKHYRGQKRSSRPFRTKVDAQLTDIQASSASLARKSIFEHVKCIMCSACSSCAVLSRMGPRPCASPILFLIAQIDSKHCL